MTHTFLSTAIIAALGLCVLSVGHSAHSEESPRHRVLLELFESQG